LIKSTPILNAVKILHCYQTNSLPLQVLCDDNEVYVIKTMFKTHPPFEDLVNEILCNYFFQCWDIPVPEPAIIKFDAILIEQYLAEGNAINKRYTGFKFENHYFFGTKFLQSTTEIDMYNLSLKGKRDYNKYQNPLDLVRIGVFDRWIANTDRRSDNSNILMDTSTEKFRFIPIDNTQAFACQNDYKALKLAVMDTVNNKSILNTPITKSICSFADPKKFSNLDKEITANIEITIDLMETIFENIPSNFGLSKKGKAKIKEILSNKERNKSVSNFYINHLK
jgi:hypothetical protein